MWELWRNATGAAGNARFARYLGQSGGAGAAARVNYAPDPRLDRYADAAAASPEARLRIQCQCATISAECIDAAAECCFREKHPLTAPNNASHQHIIPASYVSGLLM